jgi:hypothetical protein
MPILARSVASEDAPLLKNPGSRHPQMPILARSAASEDAPLLNLEQTKGGQFALCTLFHSPDVLQMRGSGAPTWRTWPRTRRF